MNLILRFINRQSMGQIRATSAKSNINKANLELSLVGVNYMAEVKLNVPLVPQSLSMSCWYAAACMVSYYFAAGPRQGIHSVWIANQGLQFSDVPKLARIEGLSQLQSASHEFSPASMIATLSRYGPIWAAGQWFGYGHVIVITGADDRNAGNIYYNDPEHGGSRNTNTIAWYNEKRVRGLQYVKDMSRS